MPLLLGLSLVSCSQNAEREMAPAPGEANYSVEINQSERLVSIETGKKDVNGNPIRVRCATCHDVVNVGDTVKKPDDLKEFHQGLTFTHGSLACANCHEPEEPLLLRLATGETVPTSEAMQLCSQCHGPKRNAYNHGAHGGKTGHWDLSRGGQLRNNCVDCHDPHSPQIQQVIPAPRPIDRGNTPPPIDEGSHE